MGLWRKSRDSLATILVSKSCSRHFGLPHIFFLIKCFSSKVVSFLRCLHHLMLHVCLGMRNNDTENTYAIKVLQSHVLQRWITWYNLSTCMRVDKLHIKMAVWLTKLSVHQIPEKAFWQFRLSNHWNCQPDTNMLRLLVAAAFTFAFVIANAEGKFIKQWTLF